MRERVEEGIYIEAERSYISHQMPPIYWTLPAMSQNQSVWVILDQPRPEISFPVCHHSISSVHLGHHEETAEHHMGEQRPRKDTDKRGAKEKDQ